VRSSGRAAALVAYDASVPLLVVKVGRYPRHHGGLGAIRSLGRVGVPTYAMTEDRVTPAAVSRFLTARTLPPPRGTEPVEYLVARIAAAVDRVARPVIALPTDDEGAVLLAEHRAALGSLLVAPAIDAALPRTLASKRGLSELCDRYGFASPRVAFPRTRPELEQFATTATFPIVAKAVEPFTRLRFPEHRDTVLHRTQDDLLAAFVDWPGNSAVMLQEYIPADVSEDWIFHGYFDAQSNCVVGFTGIKHRSWPPQFGLTTYATSVANTQLAALATRFCHTVGYRGIVDMDWRLDRRDGRYYLLDCNPRIGAQFRLFETDAGIDVVRALHLDMTGRAVPPGRQVERRAFVVESLDVASRLSSKTRRSPSAPHPAKSDRVERAWFAWDDPLPFASMAVRQLGPIWKRTSARLGRVTRLAQATRRAKRNDDRQAIT